MNKNELNNNLFDQILRYAAEKKAEELPDSLLSEEDQKEITFRPEFEKRMDNLFKAAHKKEKAVRTRRTLLKVGVATVAFLTVFSTLVFSVDALRVPVFNLFTENNGDSITIHVDDVSANYDAYADIIKGLYLPSYIPESYSVETMDVLNGYYKVIYSDYNHNEIVLRRISTGSSAGVDCEDAITESITVNEKPADYVEKNGIHTLVYQYQNNAFVLYGPISKEELLRIAESMRYRN